MSRFMTATWWFWLATALMLSFGFMGHPVGFPMAIALTAFQVPFYLFQTGSVSSFPVQVRIGYLMLLVIGLLPGMQFIHVIQFLGTWSTVLVNYCPMARVMVLMPWNRKVPLSLGLMLQVLLSPPVKGSFRKAVRNTPGNRRRVLKQRGSAAAYRQILRQGYHTL